MFLEACLRIIRFIVTGILLCFSAYYTFWGPKNFEKEIQTKFKIEEGVVDLKDISISWDQMVVIKPYATECFADDQCFSSSDDGDCVFAFLKDGKLDRSAGAPLGICGANFPVRYPPESARFVVSKGSEAIRLENSDWISSYGGDVKQVFTLKDAVGTKPYCKIFLNGQGSCDFDSAETCKSAIDESNHDEACIQNKPNASVEVSHFKLWNETKTK